jgi:hypothetical protein
MQPFTDQQRLTKDLATGHRLQYSPALQLLILTQVNWELESELRYQCHLSCSVRELEMREVHDLAAGMKDAIAGIKKLAVDAKAGLNSEVSRAQSNANKVLALTADLKAANLEVEAFLGDTNSNFPPTGTDSNTPLSTGTHDINGVTLNPGQK